MRSRLWQCRRVSGLPPSGKNCAFLYFLRKDTYHFVEDAYKTHVAALCGQIKFFQLLKLAYCRKGVLGINQRRENLATQNPLLVKHLVLHQTT